MLHEIFACCGSDLCSGYNIIWSISLSRLYRAITSYKRFPTPIVKIPVKLLLKKITELKEPKPPTVEILLPLYGYMCTVWKENMDPFLKSCSVCIMKLSDDTHSVWPQTLTISFNDGFLYLVVLHLGHPWSSICTCTQQKTRENVNNEQLSCYFQATDCGVTQNTVR